MISNLLILNAPHATPSGFDISFFIIAVILIIGFLTGIRLMQSPKTALRGNRLGALCMGLALIFVIYHTELYLEPLPWIFIIGGGLLGLLLGQKVKMIQMPQMVALLNGFGGAASAFVAGVALAIYHTETSPLFLATAALALAVGPLTFAGSVIATLKLQGWVIQRPLLFKGQHLFMRALLAIGIVLIALTLSPDSHALLYPGIILLFSIYGIVMALRVGGADMPIIIALLNSFSGIAASITGLAVNDFLLTGVGALVGVAGLVLTHLMCVAMNRSLSAVLSGFAIKASDKKEITEEKTEKGERPGEEQIPEILHAAKKVILIPGYGMAVAQAQQAVRELVTTLENQKKEVKIAVHPVAGRMPGHMNVLLAEVGIDYEMLFDMDAINPEFPETDLVIAIGACDVINPAATTAENTPIYGMPILEAEKAKNVILCNRDSEPGYSGVDNTLYDQPQAIPLWGDAAETIPKITAWARKKEGA